MSSKWVDQQAYEKHVEEREKEQDQSNFRSGIVWKTPEKGTSEKAKTYEGRFLQDPTGVGYKKQYYHMFTSGETWVFVLCPKTEKFEDFCPWCFATQKLYTGSTADKALAGKYKRKEKFVGNFYVVDDPRDADREDDDKYAGKVWLYEFPGKLESKLKNEVTDKKNGLGMSIFDPSEDGYNFIIKVKSTKPQADGKVWPDYSDSVFARRSSTLGAESEIKAIMGTRHNISEYLQQQYLSDAKHEELLNTEMLWDYVSAEWQRHKGSPGHAVESQPRASGEPKTGTDTHEEDDDLLAELERF